MVENEYAEHPSQEVFEKNSKKEESKKINK